MYERPSPRVLWSWVTIVLAVVLPVTVVNLWLLHRFLPQFFVAYLIVTVVALLYILLIYLPLRRRNMRFALGEERVTVTGGVVMLTSRRMERQAVRQVTLLQGPVERWCHTAFLLVSATGGYLLIEGLDSTRAEEWCDRLYPL